MLFSGQGRCVWLGGGALLSRMGHLGVTPWEYHEREEEKMEGC